MILTLIYKDVRSSINIIPFEISGIEWAIFQLISQYLFT